MISHSHWRTTLLLLLGSGAAASAALTTDDLFDDRVLQEVRIQMHPADWARLRRDYKDNTYYPGNLTWRGLTVENIGFRSRGFGSRNGAKPGLRVDFNRYEEDQEFLGMKSFVLKPNVQDASQLKERITMRLFARMGLPVPREAHVRLYVNDSYVGLYASVECIDKRYLERVFGEDDGYLYQYEWVEPYYFDYLGPEASRYTPSPFEPQTHERDPNPAPLVAMIRDLNEAPDRDFSGMMAQYLDMKLFMTHLALENFMAESDGFLGRYGMANYYLYRFEKKTLSQLLVWDKDRTFDDVERPIFRNFADNVLARRALNVPELRQAYVEALLRCAALAGGAGGWMDQEITRAYEQVRVAALEDPNKQCLDETSSLKPCTNAEFEQGVARLHTFAADRANFVRQAVAASGYQLPANTPRLSRDGVTHPATSASGPIVAGSLTTVYGERLGMGTAEASTLPLPVTLGKSMILINGFFAPLLAATPAQTNLQVPWEISSETVPMTALVDGVLGNTITLDVTQAAPGIFGITHADGATITGGRPAGTGDVLVIRATGLGAVSRTVASGAPGPDDPLARTREPASVTVGGVAAEVLFSGLAPGLVGVYQVNARLKDGVPSGSNTPLLLSIGGQPSPVIFIQTR